MGKELDDICTSCPYIDTVKRHKQQLGAIEEYTQWLKKEPRASYFFLFQLYTRIHNTFFSQKQQLPFTPGGTHCPEPDVTLRDLTLSPGYHSDYAPQPIPEMDSSAVVPPTNENTSPPEDNRPRSLWSGFQQVTGAEPYNFTVDFIRMHGAHRLFSGTGNLRLRWKPRGKPQMFRGHS